MEKTKPVPDRVTTDGGMGVFNALGCLDIDNGVSDYSAQSRWR